MGRNSNCLNDPSGIHLLNINRAGKQTKANMKNTMIGLIAIAIKSIILIP